MIPRYKRGQCGFSGTSCPPSVICLPAIDFQITNPQPGSSRDVHVEQPKPLRFSIRVPAPQRGAYNPAAWLSR